MAVSIYDAEISSNSVFQAAQRLRGKDVGVSSGFGLSADSDLQARIDKYFDCQSGPDGGSVFKRGKALGTDTDA